MTLAGRAAAVSPHRSVTATAWCERAESDEGLARVVAVGGFGTIENLREDVDHRSIVVRSTSAPVAKAPSPPTGGAASPGR